MENKSISIQMDDPVALLALIDQFKKNSIHNSFKMIQMTKQIYHLDYTVMDFLFKSQNI